MKNIAIFASGSGTNAENIARYFANSENVNVAVVYQIIVMLACMGG